MLQIHQLEDSETAERIGEFLTGPDAFDQIWAPNEKALVKQAVLDCVGKEKHRYWYIEDAGRIVGAIGVRENKYGSGGYEMDQDYLAVHKEYRHQGLAASLLKAVENFVQSNGGRYIHVLSCDIDSYKPARAFYEKSGYRKVGEIPHYYVENEGRIDYLKAFN